MNGSNENEIQTPPVQEKTVEKPKMSEIGTLFNIFIEPGNTFEDLRRKTRLLLALLITIIGLSALQITTIEKVGFEKLMRSQLGNNSRVQRLPDDQRENLIKQQSQPFVKQFTEILTPVLCLIGFIIAGLFYWGAANAMGGKIGYFKSLSIFVYSTFAPWLIWLLASFLVLLLKPVDDMDLSNPQIGLVNANPNLFLNLKGHSGLTALMGSLDLFSFWGMFLAVVGLQKIAKLSTGAAWGVVIIVQIILVLLKIGWFSLNG